MVHVSRSLDVVGASGFGHRPGQPAIGCHKYSDLFLLALGTRRLQILSTFNWHCYALVEAGRWGGALGRGDYCFFVFVRLNHTTSTTTHASAEPTIATTSHCSPVRRDTSSIQFMAAHSRSGLSKPQGMAGESRQDHCAGIGGAATIAGGVGVAEEGSG